MYKSADHIKFKLVLVMQTEYIVNPEDIVASATKSLCEIDIPPTLADSIDNHQKQLISLASALLAGGYDEMMVKQSIEVSFNSYKKELISTIVALQEGSYVCQ